MIKTSAYRKIRSRIIDKSIKLIAITQSFSSYQRNARKRCEHIRNIPYLSDGKTAHRLDIYRPFLGDSTLPIMIYIHGGGFSLCSKETHKGIGFAYADNGYVTFNLNYRMAPKHKYPDALLDIAAAYK
jgi:acetyl esterase